MSYITDMLVENPVAENQMALWRWLGQKSIRLKYKSNKIIGHVDAESCDLNHLLKQSYIPKNWTRLLSYS